MTTRVTILNHGADDVEIAYIHGETRREAHDKIKAGSFRDFYVYNGQDVVIREVPIPRNVPNEIRD